MDSLFGITFRDWMRLLKENHFAIDPAYWHKALFLTFRSVYNSKLAKKEAEKFGEKWETIQLKNPPIFIIGHWRSGTTLLHNIIVQDQQFAYPNLFQVSNPHTFLSFEDILSDRLKQLEDKIRPMDNIVVNFESAGEDEFALSIASLRSPIIAWAFPRHEDQYDQYLTFKDTAPEDFERWRNALVIFMKKLTLKYQKPLVLKSPVHTGRLQILNEMFPTAKFIHIHRNPYDVFQSTLQLYDKAVSLSYLHKPKKKELVNGILHRYQLMYTAYFEQKEQIPQSRFYEIAYEDLTRDMYGQIEQIYRTLELPGFKNFKPRLQEYLAGISEYQKNKYHSLSPTLQKQVAQAWKRNFEAWGYPV